MHLHLQRELIFLGLIELNDQPPVGRVRRRLDVPRQHLVALHARDFAGAAQEQGHAIQLALHHFEIEQRHLSHEAGADGDLRQHFGRVKQLALRFCGRLLPGKVHRAIRRQKAKKGIILAFRSRSARNCRTA